MVKAFVGKLTARWRNGPPVKVVAMAEDLPVPAPDDARGLLWRRRVYVVAAQPIHQIAPTVAHEAVGHFGLRALLGRRWRRFMDAIHRTAQAGRDRPLRRLRDRIKKIYADRRGRCRLPPRALADEISARAVEERTHWLTGKMKPRRTRLKERFSKVKQLLRRPPAEKIRLGYEHLAATLGAAARWLAGSSPEGRAAWNARRG